MLSSLHMRILVIAVIVAISVIIIPCEAVISSEVSGLPFVVDNGQYGLYFGLIGKVSGLAGINDSFTTSLYLDMNGGNGANFIFSLPDDPYRVGKEYGSAFDLKGTFGRTIGERYHGLGNLTEGAKYSTFNSYLSKYSFCFSRTINKEVVIESDLFFSRHALYDIDENNGIMVTPDVAENCLDYSGGSVKLIFDGRDDGTEPTSGTYTVINADAGIRNAEYFKAGFDIRHYSTPFEKDHVLASRFFVSQMDGNLIPLYEYASLGGNSTLRGYGQDRWRDKSSALTAVEYRIPTPIDFFILNGLRTVFFVEAGTVGETIASMGQNKWHLSLGIGLHIKLTEDFLIRGDLGFSDEGGNVYFFYGQAF